MPELPHRLPEDDAPPPSPPPSPAPYARFVALGDSQTEGLGDGDEIRGYRGWADRFAERLAALNPDVQYANLAVRGRLAARIRAEQLPAALALKPDLAAVLAGLNDLIRPRYEPVAAERELEAMYAELTAAGARVVTFTFPDIARLAPSTRVLRPRVIDLNARIRAAARRHGVTVVDTFPLAFAADPRIWCLDRLHANSLGHTRIAAAAAHALDLPGSDDSWSRPLPPRPARHAWQQAATEAAWLGGFLGPWALRRLRGRSTGDGRTAKRPELAPVRRA
ncbi:SGNH/GDSL hydrolase family protein [Streptomyces sp. N2-109]|uniref:SGNH/GDSL hydrolase family protein n=1 Tax=Streptomyces gossypii TaxID=2883101 RepID=A0ABT2JX26_9ACTN|nr:SGNH/GDSL hydrolase family protein [Streptomyces gossypii]MCT2592430.1 SGNH/GDSL hydrolase family protein [Streptomyces gossypii]